MGPVLPFNYSQLVSSDLSLLRMGSFASFMLHNLYNSISASSFTYSLLFYLPPIFLIEFGWGGVTNY